MKANFFDRAIGYFSPAAAARRLRERAKIEATLALSKREYAGATVGRRAGDWIRGGSDATAEVKAAGKRLRDNARALVRDNSYVSLGLAEWEGNAAPISVRAQLDEKDPAAARTANEAIDTLWYEWCRKADFHGLTDFDGLQCLIVRAVIQDGGCLVRKWAAPSSMNLPLPFQLQVLEIDYLDDSRDASNTADAVGGSIRGGIEYDAEGRRVAFWLHRSHPGSDQRAALPSIRIPADQILHIFDIHRPGQGLGASAMASVILRAQDIDGYEEAELIRKKTESCLAAFVEDANPDANETVTIGGSVVDSNGDVIETFRPGMIPYLPPGRTVKFNQPAASAGYGDYIRSQLRGMAAGLGVPYEMMTGDLSQVSFISGRMGLLSFRRRVRKLQNKVLIPQLMDPVWVWFIEHAVAARKAPDRRIWAKWTPPKWESIQPLDDANADLINMRSGARTLPQVLAERGVDPADQLREIAETNAQLDELEIILDSDPRNRTSAGNPTDRPAAEVVDPPSPLRSVA